VKAPRALIIAGLSIALPAAVASSASAATISPTTIDFGRLVIGKTSAPRTLTVTVESGDRCHSPPGPSGQCYPIIQGGGGGLTVGSFPSSSGSCYEVAYLTATTPSCTIIVAFQPDEPGPLSGVAFANDYDLGVAEATLTGIGLKSKLDLSCRKKHGKFPNKKKARWCVNNPRNH
jgi:hypothetical protein